MTLYINNKNTLIYAGIYEYIFYITLHIYMGFQHMTEEKRSFTSLWIVFMKLANTHKLKKPKSNIFQSIFIWPLPHDSIYLLPENKDSKLKRRHRPQSKGRIHHMEPLDICVGALAVRFVASTLSLFKTGSIRLKAQKTTKKNVTDDYSSFSKVLNSTYWACNNWLYNVNTGRRASQFCLGWSSV